MPKVRKEKTVQASSFGFFSNYCGPGGYGFPQHLVDSICKQHDEDYGTIMATGQNPYLHYNWADAKMQKALKNIGSDLSISETVLRGISNNIWEFKKRVTSHLPNSQEKLTSHFTNIKRPGELLELPMPKRNNIGEVISQAMDKKVDHINIQQPDVGAISYCPYVRPKFFTAKLPYVTRLDMPIAGKSFTNWQAQDYLFAQVQLNGIYNILNFTIPGYEKAPTYLNKHSKPNGRDLYVKYASVESNRFNFDYYKVLGADVTLIFHRFQTGVPDAQLERRQYMRYGLAIDATNETTTINKIPLQWPETPGLNIIDVMPKGEGWTTRVEKFHYSPDMNRDRIRVKTGDTASAELTLEGWTKTDKNPDYVDSLKIYAKMMPAAVVKDFKNTANLDNIVTIDNYWNDGTSNSNLGAVSPIFCNDFVEIRVEYTVQFRESTSLTTWDMQIDTLPDTIPNP